jgi:hypothetical protein
MERLTFLEGYGGQTIQELISLKAKYRLDSLVLAVDEAIGSKPKDQINAVERTVLAIEALEREVSNGGFAQFFLNHSNVYASVVVGDLKLINCPQTAAIVQSAVEVLGVVSLFDVDAVRRAAQDESKAEAWENLDEQFFAYPEPIAERLWEFIDKFHSHIQIPE